MPQATLDKNSTSEVTASSNITDNVIVRGDGGAKGIQGSGVTLSDADVITGVTQLNVDNLRVDGNTLSSTDTNGNINLTPDGTGVIAGTELTLTTALDETYGGTAQTTYASGDILYASAANTLSKLAKGSDGEVLTLASGVPSWAAASAGYDVSDFSGGKMYISEEFMDTGTDHSLGWTVNTANGGATGTASVSQHYGIARINRGTTAGGSAMFRLPNAFYPDLPMKLGFYMQIPTLPDGTDRFDTEMGVANLTASNGTISDGVYFRYVDDENSGNWQIISIKDTTATTADSGIAADTGWHYFEIAMDSSWTNMSFYIDGTQTSNSPLTTNIPATTDFMYFFFRLVGSDGTTDRQVNVDRFYMITNP